MDRKLFVELCKASKEARGGCSCSSENRHILAPKKTTFIIISSLAELYLGSSLMETFEVPSSIDFLRNHVAKNLPLVIRGALADSAAVKKWNSQHFR